MREKINAQIGDAIQGDEWRFAAMLEMDNGFRDASYPGCEFRVTVGDGTIRLGVNIKTTGSPRWNGGCYQSRCKITVPGDGEPDRTFGGLLYHHKSM